MIIVKLIGGLGNQMFQYAFGKAMSIRYNSDLVFDFDFFNDVQSGKDKKSTIRNYELGIFENIFIKSADRSVKKKILGNKYVDLLRYKLGLGRKNFYLESKFSYNEKVENLSIPVYLYGYWQSFNYFKGIQTIIRDDFQFNYRKIGFKNEEILQKIQANRSAVSIHVRRGDYLNLPYFVSLMEYYRLAIDTISKKVADPYFFLFSDDPQWVREKIVPLLENSILIDWNVRGDSWKDMMLMSHCRHHIIANSSFSWWAAFLGSNPDQVVIAPKKWFLDDNIDTSDLYLDDWIKI